MKLCNTELSMKTPLHEAALRVGITLIGLSLLPLAALYLTSSSNLLAPMLLTAAAGFISVVVSGVASAWANKRWRGLLVIAVVLVAVTMSVRFAVEKKA